MDEDQKSALLRKRKLAAGTGKKQNAAPLLPRKPAVFWVYVLFGGITFFALLLGLLLPVLDLAVFQFIGIVFHYAGKALALILIMALVGWGWYRFLRMLAQGKTLIMYPYGCFPQIVSRQKDPAWLFYFCVLINLIILGGASGYVAAIITECVL